MIALYDFKSSTSDEMDITKGEYIRILDWNIRDGWVYGYKCDNENQSGSFPKSFISFPEGLFYII